MRLQLPEVAAQLKASDFNGDPAGSRPLWHLSMIDRSTTHAADVVVGVALHNFATRTDDCFMPAIATPRDVSAIAAAEVGETVTSGRDVAHF